MRVLHVLNDLRDVGNGINNVTVDLACAQAGLGHEVAVASSGGEHEALLAAHGVRHLQLPPQPRDARGALRLARSLAGHVRRTSPQVVHSHNLTGAVVSALLEQLGRVRLLPRFATATTVHLEAKRGVELVWLVDRVLFFSAGARDALRAGAPGRWLPARRSLVLEQGPLGGARSRARAAASEPAPVQRPAVVTVCGLYRHKGLYDLVAAFRPETTPALASAHLHVVGAGPERAGLEAAVAEAGLADRVHLVGFDPDPRRWMTAADAFVLASRSEPAALVLAEARDCGAPVVTTDLPGSLTMVEGGAAAVVVPPGDPAALGAGIARVLHEPGLADALARRGAQGLDRLRMERYAADVVAVYADLVGGRARTR